MPECCLEVACFTALSALTAAQSCADRIELCANSSVGGTTPSFDDLIEVRAKITQPVFVMIRPRGGDFIYSEEELATMKRDIERFKELADGFVFGVLSPEGEIEERNNSMLIKLAHPRPCTMHRAFDETPNLSESLSKAITCGFTHVLTSGGASDASTGAETLAGLVRQSSGRIVVMPGGNVRAKNIQDLRQRTGAQWFHSSGRVEINAGAVSDAVNGAEVRSMKYALI